jgi:hypothetical protein
MVYCTERSYHSPGVRIKLRVNVSKVTTSHMYAYCIRVRVGRVVLSSTIILQEALQDEKEP